jgi:hypothetical protein
MTDALQLLVEMGSQKLFAQAVILLISVSQVVRITDMRHWHWAIE